MAISIVYGCLIAFLFFTSALAQDCSTTCQSFGTDFVDGGTYFQNINSTDQFTALQEFDGCQPDSSYNILVDPEGNQVQCNRSPMQPDDTPQLVTCPIRKDELVSGSWSMIVVSNNGQCDPIDYVRSFSLSVGEQTTTTIPTTITVTSTSTPIESHTLTQTTIITSTAAPTTVTSPYPPQETVTLHPLPSITVTTRGVFTLSSVKIVPSVVTTSVVTSTEACEDFRVMALGAAATPSSRREVPDSRNSVSITLSGVVEKLAQSTPAPVKRETLPIAVRGPVAVKRAMDHARRLDAREAEAVVQIREVLRKRAPDAPTLTVTDNGSTITQTSTEFAATTTVTGTTTRFETSTTTPVVTVGQGGGGVTTSWAPAETITNVFWIPVQIVHTTSTQSVTLTVTQTATADC